MPRLRPRALLHAAATAACAGMLCLLPGTLLLALIFAALFAAAAIGHQAAPAAPGRRVDRPRIGHSNRA